MLLIEQFELLHNRGSSHGESRIIRRSYNDAVYSKMGGIAIDLWQTMEREAHMKVYHRTGGLDFGRRGNTSLENVKQVAIDNGFDHEVLSAEQLRKKFPAFEDIPNDYEAVYQSDSGIMHARNAVHMMQFLAAKNGCHIEERTRVVSITPLSDGFVVVEAEQDGQMKRYMSRKVIIACGAWSKKLLMRDFGLDLLLEVQMMTWVFWKTAPHRRSLTDYRNFPIWIHWGGYNNSDPKEMCLGFYGIPEFEMSGHFKSAMHFPLEEDRNTDADTRSFEPNRNKIDIMRDWFKNTIRFGKNLELETTDQIVAQGKAGTCLYTLSPSEDFVIDNHPTHKNIAIFAAGSGHAFKFGPLLGRMLKCLVDEPDCSRILGQFDRDKFSIRNVMKPCNKL